MTGKKSRDKGQRGMREARQVLCEAFDVPHDVNRYPIGNQYTKGSLQSDLQGFPWAIEVKRTAKRLTPAEIQCAWVQACEKSACTMGALEPIVMERADKNPWWVWSRQLIGVRGHKGGDGKNAAVITFSGPESTDRLVAMRFEDWASLMMLTNKVCDWRDEVCCG